MLASRPPLSRPPTAGTSAGLSAPLKSVPSSLESQPASRLKAQGSLKATPSKPGHSSLRFQIDFRQIGQGFATQAVDCSTVRFARVEVSGIGMSPLNADGSDGQNMVGLTSSCELSETILNVPYGPARIFSVALYDADRQPLAGGTIMNVSAIDNATETVELSYRETITAQLVAERLARADPD